MPIRETMTILSSFDVDMLARLAYSADMATNYDTCFLGSCWEPFARDGEPLKLTKLFAYRVRREMRFATTEEEARRIVTANQ